MMDVDEFRARYPAFSDSDTYPDDSVSLYLDLADSALSSRFTGQWRDYAAGLFTAHMLTLDHQASGSGVSGPVESKSVDTVSVSYAAQLVFNPDAGFWNASGYGLRYYHLLRLFGAGPVQVS